jgi:glycosyltransferase involved in cell wall biosynthesis
MPLISVLITTYNRENYVKEAIESVQSSTFQDYEVVIVDDCSTDKTVSIIKEIIKKDSRFKLFVNEQNVGDYPNRIIAANYAKGEYLKYLDADDKIYPWSLEVFASAIKKYPNAALFISPTSDKIVEEFPFILSPTQSLRYHFFSAAILDGGPTCTLIKNLSYKSVGGFSNIRWISDFKLWLELATHYEVVILNQGLVYWRQHEDQQIKTETNNRKEFSFLFDSFFKEFIKDIPKELLFEFEKKSILRRYYKSIPRKFLEKTSRLLINLSNKL